MASKRKIEYDIGFNIDRSGITQLQQDLRELRIDIKNQEKIQELSTDLIQAYDAADKLTDILEKAYNSKLGQLDLSQVRHQINSILQGANSLQTALYAGGEKGVVAFNSLAKSVLNTNVYLKQGSALLNEMATSMKNTVKWGITSSIFNNLTGSLQKA